MVWCLPANLSSLYILVRLILFLWNFLGDVTNFLHFFTNSPSRIPAWWNENQGIAVVQLRPASAQLYIWNSRCWAKTDPCFSRGSMCRTCKGEKWRIHGPTSRAWGFSSSLSFTVRGAISIWFGVVVIALVVCASRCWGCYSRSFLAFSWLSVHTFSFSSLRDCSPWFRLLNPDSPNHQHVHTFAVIQQMSTCWYTVPGPRKLAPLTSPSAIFVHLPAGITISSRDSPFGETYCACVGGRQVFTRHANMMHSSINRHAPSIKSASMVNITSQ